MRDGPEAFSRKNRNARPVRTSEPQNVTVIDEETGEEVERRWGGWQLNRPESTDEWEVREDVQAHDQQAIIDELSKCPVRILKDTSEPGEKRDGGRVGWFLVYLCEPEVHEQVAARTRKIEPPSMMPNGKRRAPEDDAPEWW